MTVATGTEEGPFVRVPFVGVGFAVIYNRGLIGEGEGRSPPLPKDLLLDSNTLLGIFEGRISRWDDPALLALNPSLTKIFEGQRARIGAPITVVTEARRAANLR